MIEFDGRNLRNLQDADGIVLQNVHGKRVAIGKGFDYENIFEFMSAYFDKYGADNFATQVGYEDATDMFESWFLVFQFMKATLWIGYVSHLMELTQIHFNKNV